VYDFLLVINSNLCPISHHHWDTETYWPKITNFAHSLSFSALVRSDAFRIYGKALWFQASRRWRFGDPIFHRFWLIYPCDRQTDGQTDRQTDRIDALKAVDAFAHKNVYLLNICINSLVAVAIDQTGIFLKVICLRFGNGNCFCLFGVIFVLPTVVTLTSAA